jgi:hypothetical protein
VGGDGRCSWFVHTGLIQWLRDNPTATIASAKVSGLYYMPDWSRAGSCTYSIILYNAATNIDYSFGAETAVWVDWNYNMTVAGMATYPFPDSVKGTLTMPDAPGVWIDMDVTKLVNYMKTHGDSSGSRMSVPAPAARTFRPMKARWTAIPT